MLSLRPKLTQACSTVSNAPPIRRALVVDDEILVAMAVAEHCRSLGMEVEECYDSTDALLRVLQDSEISVLLTDVRMPRMSGTELAQRALRSRPDLLVVFLTGYADPGDEGNFGAWPVLRKPFAFKEIEVALERAAETRLSRTRGED